MRILKRLDIFVLKNFFTLFMGTFVISLFVVMMQFLWKYIDDLVGKGLGLDVIGKFFFYAAETLVPMALPLAILLAALISFGNLGERLELLAIKAAGISLWRTLRPLALLMVLITGWSYYFQDVVAPEAQHKLMQLLFSMRQKSPELDIPEGVFYDGVEGINLFVQKKNKETGILYGVIIYNFRDGVNNAHIILSDSARLETSADKQHLVLSMFSGEQFENMNSNAMQTKNVPYRRETFVRKQFIIDFNQNFEMSDADFSNSARTKDLAQLQVGIDSLTQIMDSTSRAFSQDMQRGTLYIPNVDRNMSEEAMGNSQKKPHPVVTPQDIDIDTLFAHMPPSKQVSAMLRAQNKTVLASIDMQYRADVMEAYAKDIRLHRIQIWQKITLALACIVFFFIGAPLGAIIRKGGLGMPVVVAVIIFIFYYIVNSLGYNLAYGGTIPPWVGMWFSTAVLAPIGAFFTIKSNNDSVVFNMDAYTQFFRRLWGVRTKRHIVRKEVIINDPQYAEMATLLQEIVEDARDYRNTHNLRRFPHYYKVFFRVERDEHIEQLSQKLEYCVDSLSNSKDRHILRELNAFPVLDPHAHTAPFHNKYWNMAAGIVFPIGLNLIFRMARFRRRLRSDLRQIITTGEKISEMCKKLS